MKKRVVKKKANRVTDKRNKNSNLTGASHALQRDVLERSHRPLALQIRFDQFFIFDFDNVHLHFRLAFLPEISAGATMEAKKDHGKRRGFLMRR